MTQRTRVTVDSARCQLYGVCVSMNPDVFDVPENSITLVILRDIVDGDDLADVEEAARACPAQAILLQTIHEG